MDKTSWLEDNGKYVYDDLFGGNMLEFYKTNELYTKALDVKLVRTYLIGFTDCDPADYSIALDCEVEVETLSAKEGFEGEYGIPKVGETNIIKVSILGRNLQIMGETYYARELCLRE
ncbi:MAG TPA: hypothetical protein VJ916_00995 [Anaerovoracaceae bacterium]|nr:hypothetical protein [Anaerovoracaceae bacterium]